LRKAFFCNPTAVYHRKQRTPRIIYTCAIQMSLLVKQNKRLQKFNTQATFTKSLGDFDILKGILSRGSPGAQPGENVSRRVKGGEKHNPSLFYNRQSIDGLGT